MECRGPSRAGCFQICFLLLHLSHFSLLNKIQSFGSDYFLVYLDPMWNWEVNRQLIHKVAPCDSNQVWEERSCEETEPQPQFLLSIWFSHCGKYKGGSGCLAWHLWGQFLSLCCKDSELPQERALELGGWFLLIGMNADPTFRIHMENNKALLILQSFLGTKRMGWGRSSHTNPINFQLGLLK